MRVSTMRWVDARVGVPLCFVASSLLRVVRWLSKPSLQKDKPKSVLVIKLSELGALIALGTAMRSLAELAGRENIYFLTFSESSALLEVLNYVPRENILILRTDSLAHLVWDALCQIRNIRRKRIDCSLDLDFFSRATALLGLLSGCSKRVGCHAYFGEGPYRGDLLTHRMKFNPHIHVSQMFETLAKAVEKPADDFPRIEFVPTLEGAPQARFKPTPEEKASVDRMLAEVGAGPQDTLILLNSNISDRETIPLRKWSDECYVQLARLILAGVPRAFILLTGGAKEAGVIASLEARIGVACCRSVAGKTTLRELLTLYSKSAVLVTNDSGPAHFATLTDVDVVVLFGPETPLLWRPQGHRVSVVSRNLACSPCFTVYNGRQSACRRNACMDIPPGDICAIVKRQIERRLSPL